MKQNILKSFALALVLTLSLSACGKKEPASVPAESSVPESSASEESGKTPSTGGKLPGREESTESVETSQQAASGKWITESVSKEGEFQDEDGKKRKYSYHVPHIASDSAGAAEANQYIDDVLGLWAKNDLEGMKNDQLPGAPMIGYRVFEHEGYFSLLLQAETLYGQPYLDVIHFDTKKEQGIRGVDLLNRLGIDQIQFLEAVRTAEMNWFDQMYACSSREFYDPEGTVEFYPSTLELRQITSQNVSTDIPFYIDDQDNVHILGEIAMMAGPGIGSKDLVLPFGEQKSPSKTVEDDLHFRISAELKNNHVFVTLTDPDPSWPNVKPGAVNGIGGLYGNYVDLFIGYSALNPMLMLLTDTGRVEYVNIAQCAQTGLFLSSGPIPNVPPLTGFENGSEMMENGRGYDQVFGVDAEGNKYNLSKQIEQANAQLYRAFPLLNSQENTSWTVPGEQSVWLDFITLEDRSVISLNRSAEDHSNVGYQGLLTYLGMDRTGLIYEGFFWTGDDSAPSMTATFSVSGSPDGYWDYLEIRYLAGDEFLGPGSNGIVQLERAYG